MKSLEEVLESYHLEIDADADEASIQELQAFWDSLMAEHGENVSDADLDYAIREFRQLGLVRESGSAGRDRQKKAAPAAKPAAEKKPAAPKEETKPASPAEKPKEAVKPDWRVMISYASRPTVKEPILFLKDPDHLLKDGIVGDFTSPDHRRAFEYYDEERKLQSFAIRAIDQRFIRLIDWLGSGHAMLRLHGQPVPRGFAVTHLEATERPGNEALAAVNDSYLQFLLQRIEGSLPKADTPEERKADAESRQTLILSDITSIMNFMTAAADTLPANIRSWAYQNIAITQSNVVSDDEKRHAKRALSLMLQIQWQSTFFPSVDPIEARRILDEELYGMDRVKQRIVETIVQINRTHTLPAYGLLLVGPAGTGKSQIAYAVARILKLPWASLSMSTIQDAEALTGSPRIYQNAKPGRIMEAFIQAGSSNLVFIINELDKANSHSHGSNPADTLLTLLDGLGFTDNYIECSIPTQGIYPIATANDLSQIDDPLLSRFAIINIPDYTPEERKIILRDYVMPKILRRLGMQAGECRLTDSGIQAVIDICADQPGIRAIEQAAEHIAAHALYRIETEKIPAVTFDRRAVNRLLKG